MTEITAKRPWVAQSGELPLNLEYFQGTMYEAVKAVAEKYPNNIALDFMGKSTTL